jgi:hypothetical protein
MSDFLHKSEFNLVEDVSTTRSKFCHGQRSICIARIESGT